MSFRDELKYFAKKSDAPGYCEANSARCCTEFFNPRAGRLSNWGSIGPSSLMLPMWISSAPQQINVAADLARRGTIATKRSGENSRHNLLIRYPASIEPPAELIIKATGFLDALGSALM